MATMRQLFGIVIFVAICDSFCGEARVVTGEINTKKVSWYNYSYFV